jgi:hypothetical protein
LESESMESTPGCRSRLRSDSDQKGRLRLWIATPTLESLPSLDVKSFVKQADDLWIVHQQQASTPANLIVSQVRQKTSSFKSSAKSSSAKSGRPCQPPQDTTVCFYHFNYGVKARQCKPPCSWASSVNACEMFGDSGNSSAGFI